MPFKLLSYYLDAIQSTLEKSINNILLRNYYCKQTNIETVCKLITSATYKVNKQTLYHIVVNKRYTINERMLAN